MPMPTLLYPPVRALHSVSRSCKASVRIRRTWRPGGGCWPQMGAVPQWCRSAPLPRSRSQCTEPRTVANERQEMGVATRARQILHEDFSFGICSKLQCQQLG